MPAAAVHRAETAGPAAPDPAGQEAATCLHFAGLTLSPLRRELLRAGRPIPIGERAYRLLEALVAKAGMLVTKDELTRVAWDGRNVEASNLTVQIAGLRRLLRRAAGGEGDDDLIQTVQGRGYVLTSPVRRGRPTPPAPPRPPAPGRPASLSCPAEPPTLFIGRDRERAALAELLAVSRNVCVVGIGGVGKTRLVLRSWPDLVATFPDGGLFVDLAPVSHPSGLEETVATALGSGSGDASPRDAILGRLHGTRQLLVLDNAEHLLPAVRDLVGLVLMACMDVSILVTSRETLGLPGETVFRLAPMAVPSSGNVTAADALACDAVQLFADRARSLKPDFRVDDENASEVAGICRRLDGISLAIEMAVPRLEVLTLSQLSERLHDRFRALAAPRHQVPARQRTLRAMFDWSWALLSGAERSVLQLVALLPGGAPLGTLEAMMGCEEAKGPDLVDVLASLAQKSLLVVNAAPPRQQEPRYAVLQTTRQYAMGRMDSAVADRLQRAGASFLANLFERADAEWPTMHSAAWLDRYGPEADNLRAAMRWAFGDTGEAGLALRLVAYSTLLWWELPGLPLRESRHWHQLATARIGADTPPDIQARLWLGMSWMDTIDGDVENFPTARRAAGLFRAAGNRIGLGAALWRAASTVMFVDGHAPSAAGLLGEAEQALAGRHAFKWQALCRIRRADLLHHEGALDEALAEYDVALAMVRSAGYHYGAMVCGGNRSYLLFALGRVDEAIRALRDLRRELPAGLTWPLVSQLAMLLMADDRRAEALEAIQESLKATLGTGMMATLGRTLEALALALTQSHACEPAAVILGHVLKRHPVGRTRFAPRQRVFERLMAAVEAELSPDVLVVLTERGSSMTSSAIAELAWTHCRSGPVPA